MSHGVILLLFSVIHQSISYFGDNPFQSVSFQPGEILIYSYTTFTYNNRICILIASLANLQSKVFATDNNDGRKRIIELKR